MPAANRGDDATTAKRRQGATERCNTLGEQALLLGDLGSGVVRRAGG
jgi:hypothetical protein